MALLLLTLSLALGVMDVRRFNTARWPRFVIDGLHRNASLLALVFVVVHVLTTVLDSFVSIPLSAGTCHSAASSKGNDREGRQTTRLLRSQRSSSSSERLHC